MGFRIIMKYYSNYLITELAFEEDKSMRSFLLLFFVEDLGGDGVGSRWPWNLNKQYNIDLDEPDMCTTEEK